MNVVQPLRLEKFLEGQECQTQSVPYPRIPMWLQRGNEPLFICTGRGLGQNEECSESQ